MTHPASNIKKIGVVEFLNSRPLIEGLDEEPSVSLRYAVPSALAQMLRTGQVDTALIPVIDLARAGGAWERICDAGIGSDGETLTVRVFSRVPPEAMTTLHLDPDSHTSVVLAQLIWRHWFKQPVEPVALTETDSLDDCESVLLIGDKVVTSKTDAFPYRIDLGETWKQWTGLPFIFAAWAAPVGRAINAELGAMLSRTRDHGRQCIPRLAAQHAPPRGWPIDLAITYLTDNLTHTITAEGAAGMAKFLDLARAEGFVDRSGSVIS